MEKAIDINITVKSEFLVGQKDFYNAGSVSISGGYFSKQVLTQYLATGCTCVKIADGIYQVVSK